MTISRQLSGGGFLYIIVILIVILIQILLAVQMKKIARQKGQEEWTPFFCRSFSACSDGSIPRYFPILCGENKRRRSLPR